MTITDHEDDEEAQHDDNGGGFVNELKMIHKRKLMMKQKLGGFHARQSTNLVLDD